MSEGFATFILMNNYFHDVATAMPLACSIVLRVLLRQLGGDRDAVMTRHAAALFSGVTVMFWLSVLWIVFSGAVRIATFHDFEWYNTTRKHFEAGLIVKYAVAAVMMISGSVLWTRLSRAMRDRLRQ